MYLEGRLDLAARELVMSLKGAGAGPDGAEARIEGDRAYLRQPGGAWHETDDFSGSFAPASDLLAYLAGMKNVRAVEQGGGQAGNPAGPQVWRYAFELDGPAFAQYVTGQLERQLQDSGDLPPNLSLDVVRQFRDVTGAGELWVDGRGLPLRMTVHLVYPTERNGSHLEANIKTDFSGFPEPAAPAQARLAWPNLALTLPAPLLGAGAAETGRSGSALAVGLAALVLLVACRRSRRMYAAVVLAVTFAMVIAPAMQNQQAAAFFERQTARQADIERSQDAQAAAEQALAARAGSWNPHQDPLDPAEAPVTSTVHMPSAAIPEAEFGSVAGRPSGVVAATTLVSAGDPNCLLSDEGDCETPSGDGLTNAQEALLESDPTLSDTDGDGLTDGQEALKLGTDPTVADTDGDGVADNVEVAGFDYNNLHWYLDPLRNDTNGDGLVDAIECTPLSTGIPSSATIGSSCDTDGDKIPGPFDPDNDNDSVPDRLDLSPEKVVDRSGPAQHRDERQRLHPREPVRAPGRRPQSRLARFCRHPASPRERRSPGLRAQRAGLAGRRRRGPNSARGRLYLGR